MKKLLLLISIYSMCFLIGCGAKNKDTDTSSKKETKKEETKKNEEKTTTDDQEDSTKTVSDEKSDSKDNDSTNTSDTIIPVDPEFDETIAPKNGSYPVELNVKNIKVNNSEALITLDFLTFDRYAKKDIENIKVGSKIKYQGTLHTVKKIDSEKELSDNVVCLTFQDNKEIYLELYDTLYSDYVTPYDYIYYKAGTITLSTNGIIYYDLQNIYNDKVSTKHVEPEDLVSFLNKEIQNGLSSSNTNVTIQDGSIVEIMRMFED